MAQNLHIIAYYTIIFIYNLGNLLLFLFEQDLTFIEYFNIV